MHSQKTGFLLRHLFSGIGLKHAGYFFTAPVNLRIACLDVVQHRILNLHSINQADERRLQMCQQPLDKSVILFHKICLFRVIRIDHIIDQLLELLVFHFQLAVVVPPDFFMLCPF